MRLAISNIAWDVTEDTSIAQLLHHYDIDAIDIAPSKYFPDPVNAKDQEIKDVKNWWSDHGIQITGMQSLLFGTNGLNIFGAGDIQNAMLTHLAAVCRIGAGLGNDSGTTRLVFGSPKNRDRSTLTDQQTIEIAIPFFKRLGKIAQDSGVLICLEPNPGCYGANFMMTSLETAQIVQKVDHPAIKMQLDTGSLTINHEEPQVILENYAPLIGHIHASEPDLLPLGDGGTHHAQMHETLVQHLPNHVVTVEMLATTNEPHLASIERALNTAVRYYRSNAAGDFA